MHGNDQRAATGVVYLLSVYTVWVFCFKQY